MTSVFQKAREPMSSYTHFLGAVASVFATALLVFKAYLDPGFTTVRLVSVILFGISMIALYSASAIYHFSNAQPKIVALLRKAGSFRHFYSDRRDIYPHLPKHDGSAHQCNFYRRHLGSRDFGNYC